MRTRLLTFLACILGLVAALAPGIIRADVIPPDAKGITYCFEIANLQDYPDYVILATLIPNGYQVITSECTSLYRQATFYAMKQADYAAMPIPPDGAEQRDFFANSPLLIRSGQSINSLRTVDQRDRRTAVADVLQITTLTETSFNLSFASVRYTYTDGTIQELPYVNQGERPAVPPASATERLFSFAWFLFIPLAALLALGLLILVRRRR